MKVLVTGAAGFLGHHVVKALLSRGYEVVGIDNMVGGSNENILTSPFMTFYPSDCTSLISMTEIMMHERPSYVFHAACYPHEGLSVFAPHLITKSVAMGTSAVLSAAVQCGSVKRFVNCSSMARYGYQLRVPFTEDMVPNPVDPYGAHKYAAELSIRAVCETNGIEWVTLVPHNIYGPNQKYNDPFRNVAAIMINRVLQGLQPIIYGDGTQKRCFSYVEDLIEPILRSLFDRAPVGHVINLGPEEPFIQINQLAEMVCKLGGLAFKPTYFPDRAREVRHANCSSLKARELLGVEFNTTLDDGIQKLFNWVIEQGPKEFEYHLPIEIVNDKTPKTWINQGMSK